MLARRFVSMFKGSQRSQPSRAAKPAEEGKSAASSVGRKAVSFVLITVTGGVALSALDDLSIYYGCTRKAMETACDNEKIKEAIGEPIAKGAWYSASLAVAHRRQSVSCSFPVSGPRGNGVFQMKAVRSGDDNWLSYLPPRDWEILVMDALVNIPNNEEKQQTQRISLLDSSPACQSCTSCPRPQKPNEKSK